MNDQSLEMRMYAVMDAICNSRIPIDFNGAMVLHAFLQEIGFKKEGISDRDLSGGFLAYWMKLFEKEPAVKNKIYDAMFGLAKPDAVAQAGRETDLHGTLPHKSGSFLKHLYFCANINYNISTKGRIS